MSEKPTYEELEKRIQELKKDSGKWKELEAKLHKYQFILDSAQDAIFFKDLESRYIIANEKTLEAFGLSKKEVIGRNDYEIMPDPKEAEKNVHDDQTVFRSGKPNEIIKYMTGADGKDYWFQAIKVPQFDDNETVTGLFGIARDITEHKRTERVQAAQLRLITYATGHSVKEFLQKFLDEAEVLTKSEIGFFHFLEDDQHTISSQTWSTNTLESQCVAEVAMRHYPISEAGVWVDCIRERCPVIHNDYTILPHKKGLPEGHAPVIRELVVPVFRGKKIVAILGVGNKQTDYHKHDVNALQQLADLAWETVTYKRTEEALLKSEEQYRSLSDDLPAMICTFLPDSTLTYVNRAYAEYFNERPEDLVGKPFLNFLPEDTAQNVKETYMSLSPEKPTYTYSHAVIRNGKKFWHEWTDRAFFNEQGDVIRLQGVGFDITERKLAEEEKLNLERKAQHAQKLESLGLLAGGVAHDLNNILSGIVSYPELLLLNLPEDSKFRKPIETIQKSGYRAAAVVEDLLTVARGVATPKEPLNLNDLIGDYLNSLEFIKLKQFHPKVTFKTDLDSDLLNVKGSHVHIKKAVMNLITNASEAIESSGNVTISTMNRYIDRPVKGYGDVAIGEYAVLSISDNGPGIPSDGLERIFEPFYTKKALGRSGTGLGLTVTWNVLQDHGGYINVTTDENGSTFELFFPITRGKVSNTDLAITVENFKGNGETILVVDDIESQRDISCKMLETLGYKTKAVPSGEEAVKYLNKYNVDLILLDMIMDPGINGRETYERIIKIHPNQKAIIISGFAETEDVIEAQKLGAGQYIKKPITLQRIGPAIKEELKN